MDRHEKWPEAWKERRDHDFMGVPVRNLDRLHTWVFQLTNNMIRRNHEEWNHTWDDNNDSITSVKR